MKNMLLFTMEPDLLNPETVVCTYQLVECAEERPVCELPK